MNPLVQSTAALQERGRKALVAFFTAGYPDDAAFAAMVRGAADAGADVIEIGVPFSDPIADGPVIQASSAAAVARGMTLPRALALTSELSVGVPLVVMSYVNPLLAMGIEEFAHAATAAGISGVILPDVSHEESTAFRAPLRAAGLAYIDLVAPTSEDGRIRDIASGAEGFVYLVSVTGVTGASDAFSGDIVTIARRLRAATPIPIYAGFGISGPERAREVARSCDGVILGSRLLQLAAEGGVNTAAGRVGKFLATVRDALDQEEG